MSCIYLLLNVVQNKVYLQYIYLEIQSNTLTVTTKELAECLVNLFFNLFWGIALLQI